MVGKKLDHDVNIVIKEEKLKALLDDRDWNYKELVERLTVRYGLKLDYKGLVPLLSNRGSWKLLYAFTLCKLLEVNVDELFTLVDSRGSIIYESENRINEFEQQLN